MRRDCRYQYRDNPQEIFFINAQGLCRNLLVHELPIAATLSSVATLLVSLLFPFGNSLLLGSASASLRTREQEEFPRRSDHEEDNGPRVETNAEP
jgi:hypothetical protein